MHPNPVPSFRGAALLAPLLLLPALAPAAPIDLSLWTAESYPAVTGFPDGLWQIDATGDSVTQLNNGQPTFFYSDFDARGAQFTSRIQVTASDDDFIGFALGFRPGDTTSAVADYLLIDWKQASQSFDFGSPSGSPGGLAPAGLAVSRVTGVPDADEFWQHADLSGTPVGSGLQELARGATLGSTGWVTGSTYTFDFDFTATTLKVWVDGSLEIDLSGNFSNGRFAFYNFSQSGVVYSGLDRIVVPEPGPLAMLLAGLAGVAARRKAR